MRCMDAKAKAKLCRDIAEVDGKEVVRNEYAGKVWYALIDANKPKLSHYRECRYLECYLTDPAETLRMLEWLCPRDIIIVWWEEYELFTAISRGGVTILEPKKSDTSYAVAVAKAYLAAKRIEKETPNE